MGLDYSTDLAGKDRTNMNEAESGALGMDPSAAAWLDRIAADTVDIQLGVDEIEPTWSGWKQFQHNDEITLTVKGTIR